MGLYAQIARKAMAGHGAMGTANGNMSNACGQILPHALRMASRVEATVQIPVLTAQEGMGRLGAMVNAHGLKCTIAVTTEEGHGAMVNAHGLTCTPVAVTTEEELWYYPQMVELATHACASCR